MSRCTCNHVCPSRYEREAEEIECVHTSDCELMRQLTTPPADVEGSPLPTQESGLVTQLEEIDDLLTPSPWTASQPAPFGFKVRIENYEYECPEGSAQVRADESDIPSGCLIPSGIIHHDDAEGIARLRNLIPYLITALNTRSSDASKEVATDALEEVLALPHTADPDTYLVARAQLVALRADASGYVRGLEHAASLIENVQLSVPSQVMAAYINALCDKLAADVRALISKHQEGTK